MGELLIELRKANMQAMKDHDTVKKGVLSLVISSIALAEKEDGKTLTREEELTFIQKELKQTRESLTETPADRTDLIEETKKKIEILESYLPRQLTEEEIKTAIESILTEKGLEPVKKSQGVVMKEIMAKYKGQTDGKTVNKVLSTILK
ncbi:MAG: GatB/YqeY domain-containing protein [Bulleidia sp.]|nr:GatB/YqeY domain-containing protein [Erysipelotrichaceae bacterium]MDY2781083.1 GatB/YqeY domain-containing protein [Bulleidia sp.]